MFFANKSQEELLQSYCTPKEGEPWLLTNDGKAIPKIIEEELPYLCSTLRPFNKLIFVEEDVKPWDSKLGGCPYLEDESQYPRDAQGQPMMFLAQINFEQMPHLPNFPEKGILQFYIADDESYGSEGGCCLKYFPDFHMDESKLFSENPFWESYQNDEPFDNDCKIQFQQSRMFCSTSSQEFIRCCPDEPSTTLPKEKRDALFNTCFSYDSQIGGYPYFMQSPPAYYEDGTFDVLLLQLAMDDISGLMFGDGGNCNFFISKEDLQNLNFSNVEYDWQCG